MVNAVRRTCTGAGGEGILAALGVGARAIKEVFLKLLGQNRALKNQLMEEARASDRGIYRQY